MTPPAPLYAAPARLEAWLRHGANPPRAKYAEGDGLDPKEPAMQLVRAWIARGLVVSIEERGGDGVLRKFVEVRRGAVAGIGAGIDAGAEDALDSRDRRMLAVLREHAGKRLPGNAELARLARLRGPAAARYRLAKLERLGLIERRCAPGGRGATVRHVTFPDCDGAGASPGCAKAPGMAPQGTLAEPCPSAGGGRQ